MAKKAKSKKTKKAEAKKPAVKKAVVKQDEGLTLQGQKAVDDAVAFINKRIDTASSSIIEVGQYLLKHFFEGDIQKAQDRAPRKGISLRKLAEHPDLNISFAGLSRAVNLAVQEEEIGSVAALKQFH